jgi:hypothetical protein
MVGILDFLFCQSHRWQDPRVTIFVFVGSLPKIHFARNWIRIVCFGELEDSVRGRIVHDLEKRRRNGTHCGGQAVSDFGV